MSDKPTLAVLGATGALGNALAGRWAKAGYPVIIGSRQADRAERHAARAQTRYVVSVMSFESSAIA